MAQYGLQNRVYSFGLNIRDIKAGQETLDTIYECARLGMKVDNIAYRAGMSSSELRQLMQLDPRAEEAMAAGRADQEHELSEVLMSAARGGDAKTALEILKHRHGWVAMQSIKSEVTGPNGGPVQLSAVDFRGLSSEEIETMTKLMEKAVAETTVSATLETGKLS